MAEVAVIGAGLGGLSAAIHLALDGHQVTLFERSDRLGGKADRVELEGFSFDTGPSLLTIPEVIDDLFARVGVDRASVLPWTRLDLQCRYLFDDGRRIDLVDDVEETIANIDAHTPGEGERWRRLVERVGAMHETLGRAFLERPYVGLASLMGFVSGGLREVLVWSALERRMGNVARRAMKSEAMRSIVRRYATYAGGGPEQTPSFFSSIVHVETRGGAFYPQGGIAALVDAVAALARKAGVRIVTGADVTQIVVEGGRVTGLVVDGTQRPFDAVVSNADPVTVAERLLTPEVARRSGLARHTKQELALSGFVLLMGVRGRLDHLGHHTILFPKNYDAEFVDLFEKDRMPEDPTVYLCIPSRSDPTRAPAGDESVYAMINAPANAHRVDWEALTPVAVERIKRRIERVIPDLRGRIACERVVGPQHLHARFLAPGGSIYGVTPHGFFSPFHRPMPRSKIGGLYFAGGGTQPGGGIPLVIRSGRFAAELLAQDLGRSAVALLKAAS